MTAPTAPARSARVSGILRRTVSRTPATIATILAVVVVGVVSRGLWEPFVESAGMYTWAYGLPAFDEGRWWTPVTGTFFVVHTSTIRMRRRPCGSTGRSSTWLSPSPTLQRK